MLHAYRYRIISHRFQDLKKPASKPEASAMYVELNQVVNFIASWMQNKVPRYKIVVFCEHLRWVP